MKKKEIILRELLDLTIINKSKTTQLELAKRLGVSTSTVNNAIKDVVRLGAVDVKRTGLLVIDSKKVLLYLASIRNLQKDIIYQTYVPVSVIEIEKNMPAGVIYTMFSAYKFQFNEVPADYSEVYVYADEKVLEEIKRRFPKKNGPPNLFVLRSDPALLQLSKASVAPPVQIYIDLWNARQWYAKEFLTALERKLKDLGI
ncbi:MAG: winged helix-turn-helix transcriptional regulator [Candidatus Micrarchaeia archaeon]